MKRIPPAPRVDYHAFGYLQSILCLICITWQVCSILQSRLKDEFFNANPSEETPALKGFIVCTTQICLEVAKAALLHRLLLFSFDSFPCQNYLLDSLLHMSSHAFGNVTLSAAAAPCLHSDYSPA